MDDLDKLYRIRFNEAERASKDAVWRVLCEHYFQRFVDSTDTVLEIAPGYGEFIRHIHAARKIGVDLNPDSAACLGDDVEFHQGSADDLSMVPAESVDVCFSSNFFEHLPNKEVMDQVLAEARRVLKPGGIYLAMQPNLRCEPGRYWDYYDHVLPLTHLSCREAFEKAGLQVTHLVPKFIPFSTDSRLPQHPWLVKAYLKCPWAWPLLGGQFVIVGRKPAV